MRKYLVMMLVAYASLVTGAAAQTHTVEIQNQWRRMYAAPIEAESVFTNAAALAAYVTNAPTRAYPGQVVALVEGGTATVYAVEGAAGALSLGTLAGSWATLTGKPATFSPAPHDYSLITNPPALFSGAYSSLTGTPTTFPPHLGATQTVIRAATSAGVTIQNSSGAPSLTIGAGGTGVTTADGLNVTGALQVGGTNVMTERAGKASTGTVASANITPYPIPASTNMVVSVTNGAHQRIASIPAGASTIVFPAGDTNYQQAIFLTIPPRGTNNVQLAAGPLYTLGDGLTAPASTNYTRCLWASDGGTTNTTVEVWKGAAQ